MYYYLIIVRSQALLSPLKTNNYLEKNKQWISKCVLSGFHNFPFKCTMEQKPQYITNSLGKNKKQV